MIYITPGKLLVLLVFGSGYPTTVDRWTMAMAILAALLGDNLPGLALVVPRFPAGFPRPGRQFPSHLIAGLAGGAFGRFSSCTSY